MAWKLKLAEAMNTYNPALLTLKERGYTLRSRFLETSQSIEWIAIKDERAFVSFNPLSLLGLVEVWQQRGDKWSQQPDEENLYKELLNDNFEF